MSTADLHVKVILDTSVYIPFINEGTTHPVREMELGGPLLYMSAVVIEELYAGASDSKSIKLLDRLYKAFESAGRLVVPNAGDWKTAGSIISKLRVKYGYDRNYLAAVKNDVLIALSSKQIGAYVVTNNTKDFVRIKEFSNFKLYGNQ